MSAYCRVIILTLFVCQSGCVSDNFKLPFTGNSNAKPRNVILITISSLRADHTGLLDYHRDTTPNLDKFARENIAFTQAFATSGWMMPAHASILTGLYPRDHHVTHISKKLDEQFVTLPEILSAQGYHCAGFSCNPRYSSDNGFGQGFVFYDDYSVTVLLESLAFDRESQVDINSSRTNSLINDTAISWLNSNPHQPFFMFVHYYDNHWDYLPPDPYDKMYDPNYRGSITGRRIARESLFSNPPSDADIDHIVALYDGQVRQTDEDLGELLAYLQESSLMDDTLIIIAGDHGEQFYEHGYTSHHGVYEELIHVPLVISVPGNGVKPSKTDALVSQVDILPTILDYLDITIPKQCAGKSLKPLIDGQVDSLNDYIFAEYSGGAATDMAAIRSSRYKCYLVEGQNPHGYDLHEDRWEQDKIPIVDFNSPMNNLYNILQDYSR